MPIYEYQGRQYESAETDPYLARDKIIAYLKTQEPTTAEEQPAEKPAAVEQPKQEKKPSYGQQLALGEGPDLPKLNVPDLKKPKKGESVLERATLTPEIETKAPTEKLPGFEHLYPSEVSPFDTSEQARTERLIKQGLDPEVARATAKRNIAENIYTSGAEFGQARALTPAEEAGEEARQKYGAKEVTLASRIGERSKQGAKAAIYGGLQLVGDLAEELGAKDFGQQLAGGAAQGQREAEAILKGVGENPDKALDFIETGVSGAINNLTPFLAGPAVGLTAMGTQVFGQEYGQGRDAGLNKVDAMARASAMTAAEIIGESASLPTPIMNAFRGIAKGLPVDEIMPAFAKFLVKEHVAEQVTTALQFGTDKWAPFGITPDATLNDYLNAVKDTFYQTMAQTLVAGGGATVVGRTAQAFNKPTEVDLAHQQVADFVRGTGAAPVREMLEAAGFVTARPKPTEQQTEQDKFVEEVLGTKEEEDQKEAAGKLSTIFQNFKDSVDELQSRVSSALGRGAKEEIEPELTFDSLVAKYESEGMNRESAALLANQTLREAELETTRVDTRTGQPGVSVSGIPTGSAAGFTTVDGQPVGGAGAVAGTPGGGTQTKPGTLKAPTKKWFGSSKAVDSEGKPVVLYRGLVGGEVDPFTGRPGYAVFASDNPYIASSYSGDPTGQFGVSEGVVYPMYAKVDKVVEFPVDENGTFDKVEFDKRTKTLKPGEALVARNVMDTGPRMTSPMAEGYEKKSGDVWAFANGTEFQSAISPPVTKGKRGRKPAPPEQQEAAKIKQNQMAGASRDAARNADKAAAVLAKEFNPDDYATDAEAMDAARALLADQREAIDTLYDIANSPAHRNNKAGKTAKAALEKVPAEEIDLAKERAAAKKTTAKAVLRSATQSGLSDSTNGNDTNQYTKFNNAQQALNWLARTGNQFEKLLAKRLMPFLKNVKVVIVDDISQLPDEVRKQGFDGAVGMYYESNTERVIYLARDGGINNTTFLHEAVHGATIARINEYLAAVKKGIQVSQELAKAVSDMTGLMNQSYAYFRILQTGVDNGIITDPLQMQMISMISDFNDANAFDDVKEFVAYGMTYPVFQEFLHVVPGKIGNLAPTTIDKKNGITRFVQAVRAFFGMDASTNSAMQDLIIVSERLLQAPLTQAQQMTAKLPEVARAKKQRVDRTLQKIQRGEVADDVEGPFGDLIKARSWQDAKNIFTASYDTMDGKAVRSWVQVLATNQIIDWAKSLMSENTGKHLDAVVRATEKMSVMRQKMLAHVAEQAKPWMDFAKSYYNGAKTLSRLMHYSTLEEIDPTLEATVDDAINNDKELAEIRKKKQSAAANQQATYKGQMTARENKIREAYKLWDELAKYGKRDHKSGLFPGQKIYRDIKRHYKNIFDLHRAILDERIANLKIEGDINDASTPKGKLMSAIRATYEGKKQIGVYFPLMRYGRYWVSFGKGQSREFYMFESEYQRNRFIQVRMEQLRKSGDLRSEKEMRMDLDLESGNNLTSLRQETSKASKMLTNLFSEIDSQTGVLDKETLKDAVYQMYLLTMPEQNFRSQFIHRKGTAGFTGDALRNFVRSGYTSAGQLSSLKYAPEAFSALDSADEALKGNPDQPRLSQFIDEIRRRVTEEVHPQHEDEWGQRIANGIGQASFLYYLTSIGSAITNMTAVPVYAWWTLAARYGKVEATKKLMSYMKVWNHTTFTKYDAKGDKIGWTPVSIGFSKHVRENPVLNAAFSEAAERGITEITRTYDLMSMAKTPSQKFTSGTSRAVRTFMDLSGALFHHSERLNREVTFMTSFELAYNKAIKDGKTPGVNGEAFQQAIDESVKNTYDSMFNYTRFNRPTLFKGSAGRVAFQFRMYPLQATGYFVRNYLAMWKGARGAYKNITPEAVMQEMLQAIPAPQRAAAQQNPKLIADAKKEAKTRREQGLRQLDEGATQFFGSLLMVGMFGGLRAFIGYSAIVGIIQGILAFMRDDDEDVPIEEEDIDYWFRYIFLPEKFGDKAAELLLYGPVSVLTGADIGSRVSLNDMWWRESKDSASSFDNMLSALITNVGGPAVGMAKTYMDAYDDWRNGHISQAIEKASPAGLKGIIAQQRWAEEGVTNKKDKAVLVNPEEIGVLERIYKAMGFNPTMVTERRDMQQMVIEHKIAVRKEYDDIMRRIKTAELNDNQTYLDEAIEDWIKWARKNPDLDKDVDAIYNARLNALKARSEAYFGIVEADEHMRNRIIGLASRYAYK